MKDIVSLIFIVTSFTIVLFPGLVMVKPNLKGKVKTVLAMSILWFICLVIIKL